MASVRAVISALAIVAVAGVAEVASAQDSYYFRMRGRGPAEPGPPPPPPPPPTPRPSGSGVMPTVVSATGWSPATPVTAERLYDGQGGYTEHGQYPRMWCQDAPCQFILDYGDVYRFDTMMVFATSKGGDDQIVIEYDLGDGNWKLLRSIGGHQDVVGTNPGQTVKITFPVTELRRIRWTSYAWYSKGSSWGHVTEFRMGLGDAPPIP
jgi:U5 snRNP spliceosome subunit